MIFYGSGIRILQNDSFAREYFFVVWWKNAVVFAPVQFILVKEQLVEFNQLAIEHANGHEDMLNRVMTKDNIALAALLHTREPCWENGIPPDPSQVR